MPDEKNKNLRTPKMRMFPILLVFIASILFNVMSGRQSLILLSLGEFAFTVSFLLVFITAFNEIITKIRTPKSVPDKKVPEESSSKPKRFIKIRALFAKLFSARKHADNVKIEIAESEEITDKEETTEAIELIEIHKDRFSKRGQKDSQSSRSKYEGIVSVLYILSFIGIAYWRIGRMLTVLPLSISESFSYSIIYAIMLLVFPCVFVFYLKMRKDAGIMHGDKTSHDMLMLLSYVSLVYAATIAAISVLNINILVIMQWAYYIVTVYLFAALAMNILFSVMKNDILGSFNYTLIPQISKAGDSSTGILDSEEVKLNFSLKSLYTIRYTLQILPWLALSLGCILFLSTTMFVVTPYQEAVVYRLGKISEDSIVGKGFHFKLPWPIEKAYIYDVNRVQSMLIGYESSGSENFLWGKAHDGGEYRLLLGNGNELTAVNMRIVYKISDLYSYVTTCTRPTDALSSAAYEAIMHRTVNTTIDRFLSVDRSLLSASLQEELSEFCEREKLGLSVVQVIIESIHPPIEVAGVYQAVVSALVNKNATITYARTSAEAKIIEAEQQSKTAIDFAKAEQYRKTSIAQNEMAVYYAAMEAHKINPESFKLTKYLNTYEAVIRGSRVYAFSPSAESSISKSFLGKLIAPINTQGIETNMETLKNSMESIRSTQMSISEGISSIEGKL